MNIGYNINIRRSKTSDDCSEEKRKRPQQDTNYGNKTPSLM